MPSVDLNADLGESFGVWELGDDDAMLDIVTSANIACGFHAGDPVRLAAHLPVGRATRGAASARRSATTTWPDSAAASSTSRPPT